MLHLCQAMTSLILKHDRRCSLFYFSPIQSYKMHTIRKTMFSCKTVRRVVNCRYADISIGTERTIGRKNRTCKVRSLSSQIE